MGGMIRYETPLQFIINDLIKYSARPALLFCGLPLWLIVSSDLGSAF